MKEIRKADKDKKRAESETYKAPHKGPEGPLGNDSK